MLKVVLTAYETFDTCEHYGVDQYLSSFGLSVEEKYRGRGIGDRFLDARYNTLEITQMHAFSIKKLILALSYRKFLCKEFGLALTHTIFSSDYSNRNADKVGFKTDVSMT